MALPKTMSLVHLEGRAFYARGQSPVKPFVRAELTSSVVIAFSCGTLTNSRKYLGFDLMRFTPKRIHDHLVSRTGNNGTNETDFFCQARRKPAAVWGIRQVDATQHGEKRRCFIFRYFRFATLTACKAVIWLAPCANTFLLLSICAASIAAETAPQSAGKWQITSPAGDDSLTLSLKAEKPVSGWMKTSVPVLTIQCSKGKAALHVETGMALEVTMIDQQIVHIHFDDNKPFPQRWREVTNATVSATARDATALIKQFTQSQKFMFEFIPFNVASAQAEFAVAGLSAYSPQLAKACWGK